MLEIIEICKSVVGEFERVEKQINRVLPVLWYWLHMLTRYIKKAEKGLDGDDEQA